MPYIILVRVLLLIEHLRTREEGRTGHRPLEAGDRRNGYIEITDLEVCLEQVGVGEVVLGHLLTVEVNEDVLGFDVAVYYLHRVDVLQGQEGLHQHPPDDILIKVLRDAAVLVEFLPLEYEGLQVYAVKVFLDQAELLFLEVKERFLIQDHVTMLQT